MYPQVVQDREDLFRRITGESLHERDEVLGIEILVDDHPAGMSPIGHGGDHRQLVAGAAHGKGHWRFPFR